jgi:hypothetical protein
VLLALVISRSGILDISAGRTYHPRRLPNLLPNQIFSERNPTMLRKTALVAVAFVCMLGLASGAFAQKATVLRVIVVKTDNVDQYVQEVEKGKELFKQLGIEAKVRVWQARYAGPEAGAVVVSVEFPSLAALAASESKLNSSTEYQAWIKGLEKIRTIVSDSLYGEL